MTLESHGTAGEYVKLVDYNAETLSNQYGAMTMQCRPSIHNGIRSLIVDEHNLPVPTYEIVAEAGIQSFLTTGMEGPPRLIKDLLERHGLTGDQIALIGHQASRKLIDCWNEAIKPKNISIHLNNLATLFWLQYQ